MYRFGLAAARGRRLPSPTPCNYPYHQALRASFLPRWGKKPSAWLSALGTANLSDRCEMNRQIRADNSLLRQLKEEVKHLLSVVATNIPVILENLRDQILLLQYQLLSMQNGLFLWWNALARSQRFIKSIRTFSLN